MSSIDGAADSAVSSAAMNIDGPSVGNATFDRQRAGDGAAAALVAIAIDQLAQLAVPAAFVGAGLATPVPPRRWHRRDGASPRTPAAPAVTLRPRNASANTPGSDSIRNGPGSTSGRNRGE